MSFIPSIITRDGNRMLALGRDQIVPLSHAEPPPKSKRERKPLTWPLILRDDPATKVCEACDQFSVRHDGCPKCAQFKSCAQSAKFKNAVLTRACPLGRLSHVQPAACV